MHDDGKPVSFFESKEFATTSNKEVASILETTAKPVETSKTQQTKVSLEEAAWGDNDIEIDEEDLPGSGLNEETKETFAEASDIFVPPSAGTSPLTAILKKNPLNTGINVAAGNFQKGLELLQKSIAVKNFDPLKQLFIDTFTLSKVKLQTLPHGP